MSRHAHLHLKSDRVMRLAPRPTQQRSDAARMWIAKLHQVRKPIDLTDKPARVSMHADYPQRLRAKLDRQARRRAFIRSVAPMLGFIAIGVIVIALMVTT